MVQFVNYSAILEPVLAPQNFSLINQPLDIQFIPQQLGPTSPTAVESPDQPPFKWSRTIDEESYLNYFSEGSNKSDNVEKAISYALSKVGSPYVWGAKGKNNSYDCSGLIYAAYKAAGIDVPESTLGWLSSNKKVVDKYSGKPGDVIITSSKQSKSGRHARLITKNLGNGIYECVEAKGKNHGVVTSTYTVDSSLKNIYRAKQGLKLIKKS